MSLFKHEYVKRLSLALLIMAIFLAVVAIAYADYPVQMRQMLTGRNVYSPEIQRTYGVWDTNYDYFMYYGGWETQADVPEDDIMLVKGTGQYYDIVWDNNTRQYVIEHQNVTDPRWSVPLAHVNDPTIVWSLDQIGGNVLFMYFTGIPCWAETTDPSSSHYCGKLYGDPAPAWYVNNSDFLPVHEHDVYFARSYDGVTWTNITKVIDGFDDPYFSIDCRVNNCQPGVFSPTAQRVWQSPNYQIYVWAQIAGPADKLVLYKFSGTDGTTPISGYSPSIKFQNPGGAGGGVHNPDISVNYWSGGAYPITLFYNRIYPDVCGTNNASDRFDIHKAIAPNFDATFVNDETILYSGGNPYCIANTPHVNWYGSDRYWMYFGLDTEYGANPDPHGEIHGWDMRD